MPRDPVAAAARHASSASHRGRAHAFGSTAFRDAGFRSACFADGCPHSALPRLAVVERRYLAERGGRGWIETGRRVGYRDEEFAAERFAAAAVVQIRQGQWKCLI